MTNRYPALTTTEIPIAWDADEEPTAHATGIRVHRPSYAMISPLLDHVGSRRQDGWAMRIDLSDGRSAYLSFARRKLWRGETTRSLGTCDGIEALLTIEGEAHRATMPSLARLLGIPEDAPCTRLRGEALSRLRAIEEVIVSATGSPPVDLVAGVEALLRERDEAIARADARAPVAEVDAEVDVEEVLRLDRKGTPSPWYARLAEPADSGTDT